MNNVFKSLWLLGFSVILCCGLYPLVLWSIGQSFFSFQANGSLLRNKSHTVVGSKLIAQSFSQPEYFHPRPSASDYNASASASSALAASNDRLRQRIIRSLTQLAKEGFDPAQSPVPADAVMTSASGLDPFISRENANRQLDRVTSQWAKILNRNPDQIKNDILTLLEQNTVTPLAGLAGEKIVNSMTLNWILSSSFTEKTHG